MPDLHGCKELCLRDWNEDASYLERVTIADRDAAIKHFADEFAVAPDELNVMPIHMRWIENEGKEAIDTDGVEYREGWIECPADHPDAVPFWKDVP